MVKLAAETVPVVAGRVTPPDPPVVRAPEGARITVPEVDADIAILPNSISFTFVIVIGAMISAVAEAVAVAWANTFKFTIAPTITRKNFKLLFFFIFNKIIINYKY